jgi:hypothetical protein
MMHDRAHASVKHVHVHDPAPKAKLGMLITTTLVLMPAIN